MPSKQRRYALKTKDAKQVLTEAQAKLKLDLDALFGSKAVVEVVESDVGEVYLIGEKPLLFKAQDKVLPTLHFTEFTAKAPKIVVDMGAVPYVCKGATVMAPGIVRIEGDIRQRRPRSRGGREVWQSPGAGRKPHGRGNCQNDQERTRS